MRIVTLCLLAEILESAMRQGVIGRARENGLLDLQYVNPRDFATDAHRTVDDRPYGGGPGMVMCYEPLAAAHASVRRNVPQARTIVLSPQGIPFTQTLAREAAEEEALILVAGRYEGIDERFLQRHANAEWSIGDYVISGGELAAAVVIDAIARLLPGVLGCAESAQQDSFDRGILDCPHYTRPEEIDGLKTPDVLLSGNHGKIDRWRRREALIRTWQRRPDLLDKTPLSAEDQAVLDEYRNINTKESDRERDD